MSKSEATVLGISTAESLSSETFYRGFTPIVERTNSKMNYNGTKISIGTQNTYDHAGRLIALDYSLFNNDILVKNVTMAAYSYNELGQLSSKKLHKEGNNAFIQAITHQYNICGWLTHINNNTRTTNLGTEQPLFGMELYYNTLPTSFGNVGKAQFNCNISATSWSSIRDKEITNANIIRGFTYSYDKMNRLITANFQSVKPEELGRYSTAHSYDVNGNIQTTQRSGVISSNGLPQSVVYQYGQMDNMQYSYAGNRLMKVNDAITTQTTLPDFNDNGSTDIDYGYDNNGNLTKDLNKKIESIAYNHLNLPTKIIFTGKGNITYTYNAAGAKLTKTVTETGKPVKIVAYKYGFLFENEVLKEFATPEGRVVYKTPPSGAGGLGVFQFQYHYKDHLGNVRMTFAGQEPLLGTLKLTMEVDSLEKESKDFNNIILTRTNQDAAEGRSSASLAKQKGVISSRIIAVKKGEKLTVSLQAKYDTEEVLQDLKPLSRSATIGKVLGNSAALLAIQDVNIGNESKSKSLNINILAAIPLLKNLFSKRKNKDDITIPYKPQKPQSYVEIAVYKDSLLSELLTVQRKYISENSEFSWQTLQDSLTFEIDGFAVVSLRNESDKNVLFDDLILRTYGTQKARIIQENHYEPFGMTLQGLDYVAEDTRKNSFLFGGKELSQEMGLEGYDFVNRGYDPQRGQFNQIDPLADKMRRWTPYHYCFDNPLRFIDPDGMWPTLPEIKASVVSMAKSVYHALLPNTYTGLNNAEKTVIKNNTGATTFAVYSAKMMQLSLKMIYGQKQIP